MTASIRSRFAFSLLANLLKALVGFVSGLLVARGLGPEQYGKMMFLLGTFIAVRQLLDLGSSTAFFTFLSQRPRSRRFVAWYSGWLGVQFLVPLIAVWLLFPAAWVELIWKGEQRSLVVMAFVAAYMQSTVWSFMMQMGESQRLTRWVQGVSTAIALLHISLVAIFWWQDWLGIRLLLAAFIFEWALAAWVIATQLRFSTMPDEDENLAAVFREFGRYCLPMIPYCWMGFAYEFADRWLLQNYGGSIQQAFYAVASQFGVVAAIATTSILNVFWKEIAEAHHQGNKERVSTLYRNVSRGLFFVAASVAGFLMPWSKDILHLTLGPAYVGGATALTIMFLYPIHQSMGQIGGTMLYATGQVRAQVVMGMFFMAASIVVTYFVLAPADAQMPGLDLGSAGLAGKIVILQFISVNVVAFYLARSLQMTFDWVYQPLSGLGCLGAGCLAYAIPRWLFDVAAHVWVGITVSAIIYVIMLFSLIWLSPSLVGLSRGSITYMARRVAIAGFRRQDAG